ncbi:50S ribosomal protein L18 [Sulfodiicoccus acidiphilus]|uniref:Large ribosomal subunit protein uL18 n=1 Tax=Sulfodiicoccus acidiphilus TaxID=1670455 RepID=A0A348B161_9CREN|nr:50S ribosomal protein L18 [Sulfodiicoccus acidiphilus]BBD71913.1 50S ribosomal protein L18 [Sulfodiicoccus acidiphilus]GGT91413.1 50S ribosomal protein L18 [Sulfodiicoccus acidiphilus]
MKQGPNYKLKQRRRREGKTNYYRRYTYVVSGVDRLVVRFTNKAILVSLQKFDPKGDLTVASASSFELAKKYGWKGDLNNSTAAYLTGFLLGKRAIKAGVKEAVLDIGNRVPAKGSRLFIATKGVIDSGLTVPMNLEVDEGRLRGEHVAKYAEMLEQQDPERFKRVFSKYFERGLNPKDLPSHFKEVLNKLSEASE